MNFLKENRLKSDVLFFGMNNEALGEDLFDQKMNLNVDLELESVKFGY